MKQKPKYLIKLLESYIKTYENYIYSNNLYNDINEISTEQMISFVDEHINKENWDPELEKLNSI